MNSKQKGKRGEIEVAHFLHDHGFTDARRGQQFHGGAESPDVIGIDGIHLEVKRTERTDLYGWMEQAKCDAGENIPVVVHRKNGEGWLAILPFDKFLEIVKGWMNNGEHSTDI